jgi:hypothetical protein
VIIRGSAPCVMLMIFCMGLAMVRPLIALSQPGTMLNL